MISGDQNIDIEDSLVELWNNYLKFPQADSFSMTFSYKDVSLIFVLAKCINKVNRYVF